MPWDNVCHLNYINKPELTNMQFLSVPAHVSSWLPKAFPGNVLTPPAVAILPETIWRQDFQSSGRELCWGFIVQHSRETMEKSYKKGSDVMSSSTLHFLRSDQSLTIHFWGFKTLDYLCLKMSQYLIYKFGWAVVPTTIVFVHIFWGICCLLLVFSLRY